MYQEFEPKQPKRPRWIIYAVIAAVVLISGVILLVTGVIPGLKPGEPAAETETGDFFMPLSTPSAAPATTVAPPFEITEETEEAKPTEATEATEATEETEAAETEPAATEAEIAEVTAAASPTSTQTQVGTPLPNLTPTEPAAPTDAPTATLDTTVTTPTLIAVGASQLTPTPTATPVAANFRRTMTFEQLGRADNLILESPNGSDSVYFNFPLNWALSNTSTVEIQYDVIYTAPAVDATQQAIYQIPAVMEVFVDDERIATIDVPPASAKAQRATIQLPPGPFNDPAAGTYHEIVFTLDAGELCELPVELKVDIDRIVSVANFDYGLVPPTPDLSIYPRPLYNSSGFDPESVLLVLPDQPSLSDLSTAAAFSANLGSLSRGQIMIDVLRAGEVGTAQRTQTNLVLIGQPSRNALTQELYASGAMPSQLSTSQVNVTIETPEASPFDYNITLRNKTDAALTDLTLEAALPDDIQAETCSGGCRSSGDLLVWAIPQLAPDEVLSLSITIADASAASNPIELVARQGQTVIGMDNNGLANVDKNTLLFFNNTAVALHEGLVEEVVSPYNPQMVILVFTGLSDEAVLQSVYGISSAVTPRYFLSGQSAVIRDVQPGGETIAEEVAETFTLEDLGYDDATVYGTNETGLEVFFDVPLNWELTEESLVRIEFSHSATISEELSVMTVALNQVPIGSVQLDRTNVQNGVLEVELPDTRIEHGETNLLEINVDMDLDDECLPPDSQLAWATISRDSMIRLTHVEATPEIVEPTLGNLPGPFSATRDLSDTLMVLPEPSSSRDIQVMMQLANFMGSDSSAALFSPKVTFASLLEESDLTNNHLIVLGSPSSNELFEGLNSNLPQPFDLDNDTISQKAGDVIYRLPPGFSIGVVQILPSPFADPGSGYAALVISGSNEQGIEWSRQAFIVPTIRRRMVGDLAYINDTQVENFVTTANVEGAVAATLIAGGDADIMPEMTPGAEVEATLDPLAPTVESATATLPAEYDVIGAQRPEWLDLATIVIGVIVLGILGIAFFTTRRRAKEE